MTEFHIDTRQVKKKTQASSSSFMEKAGDILTKDYSFSYQVFGDQVKEQFYYELGVLLEAGIDIKSAMELIIEGQRKAVSKKIISDLNHAVLSGSSLSEAMKQQKVFGAYEYYSIQIGEETGKLVPVLKQLAAFFKNKVNQRRQVISASTYPVIVMSTALGAVFFMLKFVVPMFADIFKRYNSELPWITRKILDFSNSIGLYLGLLGVLVSALLIITVTQKRKDWFRHFSSAFVLRIPVIGNLVARIFLARYAYSMSLLISARVPMLRAIHLVKQMVGFYPIESALTKVEAMILQGESLHQSLSHFPIFPKRMISLLKAGEEVNKLDSFFEKMADQFTEEVNHLVSVMGSLIEPVIIIFLGLVVGIILIAMYLPLFQISNVL